MQFFPDPKNELKLGLLFREATVYRERLTFPKATTKWGSKFNSKFMKSELKREGKLD